MDSVNADQPANIRRRATPAQRKPDDDSRRKPNRRDAAGERRAVGVIALIAMLRMFGLFALLPVLSLYAAELEGATPLLIGLAVGAYGLTQAGSADSAGRAVGPDRAAARHCRRPGRLCGRQPVAGLCDSI